MNSRKLTTVLLVILGVIVLLPVLGMSLWGFGMMGPGMMGPGMMGPGMMGRGAGGFAGLTLLLLLAGIVLIVLGFTQRESRPEEPLEILKRRLARGEITREQYEEMKQVLQ
jgi:uncharacterized membrane protein